MRGALRVLCSVLADASLVRLAMRRTLVIGSLIMWSATIGLARARTLADRFGPVTRPLGVAIADSIGRSLPTPAASAGLLFHFDPSTWAFTRETAIAGQLFLENPTPIGRGRWNIGLAYQWIRLDAVDGRRLDGLHDPGGPIRSPQGTFRLRRFDLALETHEALASVTWGATDDLELNIAAPLLATRFGLDARLDNTGSALHQSLHARDTRVGIGDVLLRAKYRAVSAGILQAALGAVLRLPTGSRDDFQGTGSVEAGPQVYIALGPLPLAEPLTARVYLNGGLDLRADDVDRSEARWGAGVDVAIADRATLAIGVLARHPWQRTGAPGAFNVPRTSGNAPLLGLHNDRPDFYDASIGVRVDLWRALLIGFVHVLVPLNHDGFRPDVVPLAGVEAAF